MKNLIGLVVLGVFLYVAMGGNMPSVTHYLDDSTISYDTENVADDDVFVGLHVSRDEDGSHHVRGVSHRGELLVDDFWSYVFQRDPAVQRSYAALPEEQVDVALPCDSSFVDVAQDPKGKSVDLLGDLCIVDGVAGARFYPHNHIRRGGMAKMVARSMMYVYQGNAGLSNTNSSYEDVPEGLQSAVAQLELWGIDDVIARDSDTFGVDDIMTKDEVTQVVEAMVIALPETISVSDSIPVPVSSGYVTRDMAAHMVASALALDRASATSILALR